METPTPLSLVEARLYASEADVMRVGVSWPEMRAIQQQHISVEDANQWLAAMIAQGWSPVDDLHILLEEKG